MQSVTTTKIAAAQYIATYESKNNEPPKVSSRSDYSSAEYTSGPHSTPRDLMSPTSDYQSQLQLQQQNLYSNQYQQQPLQLPQVDRQPWPQPALEQARQLSMDREENFGNRPLPPLPFGSANSARHQILQSSMKKAASILPTLQPKVYVVGTPTRENVENTAAEQKANDLDHSGSSSLQSQYGPPRFESSVQLTNTSKPNSNWKRFLARVNNDDTTERVPTAPATYWCFVLMGGVGLLILIILICLLIARLDVQEGMRQ